MDSIEEVRRKTDIVDLISQYVTLKKSGRNFKALCPFHDEKTPSFMVSAERQIFKCFGCQEGGDAFAFLMKKEAMEFGEALRYLADKAGIELKQYQPTQNQKHKEKLLAINHLASEYYHYLLNQHKSGTKAIQYLLKRGISKTSIKTFKLGFAPLTWEGLAKYLHNKKGYSLEELEAAGLSIKGEKGFYDRFRGRVMFTLFDLRSRVVGFAGRVMEKDPKEAKYINTPETEIYHKSQVLYGLETTKEAIKKANKAVVVEGELDAISSYQAGVKNVVAIKGSALTEQQIDLLKRFTDNLALALDADAAGDAAARRGIELAEAAGMNIRVINLKYGKDPDECAQHSSRLWKDSVDQAVPIYDYLIASAKKRFGTDTPEGKRQISEEVARVLSTISNQVVKAHYIKKLAEVLDVGEAAVAAEVDRQAKGVVLGQPASPIKPVQTREEKIQDYVLALLIQSEVGIEKLVNLIEAKWFSEGAAKKVIEVLLEWAKAGKDWNVGKFVAGLPAELTAAVDTAYLTDLSGDQVEDLAAEISRSMGELKNLRLKQQLTDMSARLKEAEAAKDKNQIAKLQSQFVATQALVSSRN